MLARTTLILSWLALFASPVLAQNSEKAFRLTIGEQGVDIDAGETVDITLPDGSKVNAKLERNDFATFAADRFSFMHASEISVSQSDLGDGVVQYLMATAIGSMVIIQTYDGLNPAGLTGLMLNELTEDDAAVGAKIDQTPTTRKVGDKVLEGLKATKTLKDEVSNYEILAYSAGDSGVIFITGLDRDNEAEDAPKIAKFWETLKLK